jgi:hypothetical protein
MAQKQPPLATESIQLKRPLLPVSLSQLAINPQLGPAHCQKLKSRFRFAGFDLIAQLELPLPDVRGCGWYDGKGYTLVSHGCSPFAIQSRLFNLTANEIYICSNLLIFQIGPLPNSRLGR